MIQPPEQGIHVDLCRRKKGLRSLRNDGVKMLDHVPPVLTVGLVAGVVSGIVSGGVSLLVVYLSNRSQNERLQMQLTHERELKNREREMALRRDVYLPAVEAVSAGLQALSQFPALGFPTERLTERYQEKAPSVAKAQVIAKEKTVRTFAIFNSELGAIFLRLTLARMPLLLKKPRLQILLEDIGKLKTEHSAVQVLLSQLQGFVEVSRTWCCHGKFSSGAICIHGRMH